MEVKTEAEMEVKKQPVVHILAVPFPAQSHISAMMHLCRRLSLEQDLVITFASVDSIHEQMKQHWSGPTNIRLEPLPFSWNIPNGFDAYCVQHNGLFADHADKQLGEELRHLVTRLNSCMPPVCCIVSDYFLPWTQRVSDQLQLPRVALWSGCASWACIEYHVPELISRRHIFSKDPEDCLIDYVGGIPRIERRDLPLYLQRHTDQLWKEEGLKRTLTIAGTSRVFINSFYALESQAFDYMQRQLGAHKVLPVGPLYLLSESSSREQAQNVVLRPEDVESIRWLDTQQPSSVLYISFGSITVLSREQLEELAKALEATRTPFLWATREELNVEVGDELEKQGRIISWAPQLQVLKHRSVGGFLTHCGWNSMLESMTNGVPMVGWPWAGEQNTNCKLMVDEWKLGARVGGTVAKEEISRVIKLVMEDKELKRRVQEIKSCTAQAVREADGHVKAFLDELRKPF